MKVIVTGGAGFIGSHLTDALVARGDDVVVVDDLSSGSESNLNPGARFERLDVRSAEAADLVRSERPDGIAHLAAQVSVSRSVREPRLDADINVMGSVNLMSAAAEIGARFVFASTGGAMYGATEQLPTPEDHPAWPVSPYGIGKLAAEHYLFGFRAQQRLSYAALRYANVYGPRQDPHGEAGVVAIFCLALLEDRLPRVHGDGTDTRDYVHVADVVRANLLALDGSACGHFNVGTGRQTNVNDVYRLVRRALQVGDEPEHGPPRPGDLRASALDSSRFRGTFGWQPEVELEAGVRETAEWFAERARSG